MTRTTRSRTRVHGPFTGSRSVYNKIDGTVLTPTTASVTSSISDSRGRPVVASSMDSTQYKGVILLNGTIKNNFGWSTYGQTVTWSTWPILTPAGDIVAPLTAPNGWYLSTVARSNPSRPVMTPLTLLQDLRDIPSQLRELGRLWYKPTILLSPKQAADQYLVFKFGWLPLIGDVLQLLDLQSYILRKVKELNQLYSGRGLRRKIQFSNDTTSTSSSMLDWPGLGSNSLLSCTWDRTVSRKSWATIRWKPTTPPRYGHGRDEEMNHYARRIVLGLTPEGCVKGAWDIIPWTWLVGWFFNIGDYALAYSNTVPASHSEACFMSEVKIVHTPQAIKLGRDLINMGFTTTGSLTYTRKTRIVSGALVPGFNVPFLDTSRLSVLAALFCQRFLR